MRSIQSGYKYILPRSSWWDACHHPHWCFYEGSWCGCFWSGQNKIPIAAASKGNCKGAWQNVGNASKKKDGDDFKKSAERD
ncbi:hypothetical protein Bca52824_074546 [Brassica carinata]|uniref:Uncharacterized protein n=1 Tax=Brassica carinata TaxID=52824 RepID=A0A8X7PR39_BRACI|nr:hypothetical protein Bca52824_074546 [Brassica carinata]